MHQNVPSLENTDTFISGLAIGFMLFGDIALIAFVSAGYRRWGLASYLAVLGLLALVVTAVLIVLGAPLFGAYLTALEIGFAASLLVLPFAAPLTWLGWKFWNYVGGLHAQ
jgi:hypothetical protein